MSDQALKGPDWRTPTLLVSILLNLFLLAVIGGHLLHVRRLEAERVPMAQSLARIEAELPRRDADALAGSLKRDAPLYADQARQLRAARQAFDQAMTAEPFDRERAIQALRAWRAAWTGFMDAFQSPLIDALGQVSPEGRRRLAAERGRGRPPMRRSPF
jgi:uncharacterized membrane protein